MRFKRLDSIVEQYKTHGRNDVLTEADDEPFEAVNWRDWGAPKKTKTTTGDNTEQTTDDEQKTTERKPRATGTKRVSTRGGFIFTKKTCEAILSNMPKDAKEKEFAKWWEEQLQAGTFKEDEEESAKKLYLEAPDKFAAGLLSHGRYIKAHLGNKGTMGNPWVVASLQSFKRYTGERGYDMNSNPFLRYVGKLPNKVFNSDTISAPACAHIEELISKGKILLDNELQMKIFTDPRAFKYKNFKAMYDLLAEMSGEDGPRYFERSELHWGKDGVFDKMLNADNDVEAAKIANNIRNPGNGRNRGKAISANDEKGKDTMYRKVISGLNKLQKFQKMSKQEQMDFLLKFVTDTDDSSELMAEIVKHWDTRNNTLKAEPEQKNGEPAANNNQQTGEQPTGSITDRTLGHRRTKDNNDDNNEKQ